MKILRLGYVCDALWPVKIWLPPPWLRAPRRHRRKKRRLRKVTHVRYLSSSLTSSTSTSTFFRGGLERCMTIRPVRFFGAYMLLSTDFRLRSSRSASATFWASMRFLSLLFFSLYFSAFAT